MTTTHHYDVQILHLLVSPGHAYFGRARDGAADVPTVDADRVELVAGKGLVGDRFFGQAAHMDAAVTLLAPLLGEEFALESRSGLVRFLGGRAAHPCAWMDRVLAPGAHAAMRGRGGARCRALSDGVLHRGPAVLHSPVPLDPERAGTAELRRPNRWP